MYGVPLATKAIQPVWIEVENHDDRAYFLLSPGLDPNFFPASEAAEAFASGDSREQRAELDRRFRQLAFRNPVLPGDDDIGVRADQPRRGRESSSRSTWWRAGARRRSRSSRSFPAFAPITTSAESSGARSTRPRRSWTTRTTPLSCGARGPALLRDQQGRLQERRSPQSGGRGRPRRCVSGTRAARLASDRGEVVGLDHEDDDVRDIGERYRLCAGERSLPLRTRPGLRAAEGARQHPPAQPPAAVAEPDALPRQAGLGGPDQPRHRQPSHHPFADTHDAQDRPGRGRSARSAGRGHGLFAGPGEDRVREGRGRRPERRPAREPHHRSVLHRRTSRSCSCSTASRPRWRRSSSFRGVRATDSRTRPREARRECVVAAASCPRQCGVCGELSLALVGCATWQAPAGVDDAALRARATTATPSATCASARRWWAQKTAGACSAPTSTRRTCSPSGSKSRTGRRSRCGCCGREPTRITSRRWKWRGPCTRRSREARTRASTTTSTDSAFKNPIPPGATRAGVVFTNPQRGTTLLNIDLFGSKTLIPFSLFLHPDDHADEACRRSRSSIPMRRSPTTRTSPRSARRSSGCRAVRPMPAGRRRATR